MSTSSTVKAYRSLLRELYKSSLFPRSARNTAILTNFRQAVSTKEDGHRQLENAATFLRADRIYKVDPSFEALFISKVNMIQELLERYSPLRDLTEEEKIKATARRVGLDVPKEFKTQN